MTYSRPVIPGSAVNRHQHRAGIFRKPIARLATGAFTPIFMSLKHRSYLLVNTVRTYIVHGLLRAAIRIEAIHNRTGLRFPHMIASHLLLKGIGLLSRTMQSRKSNLQLSIRELRIRYLISQLGKRGFDLRISSALRFREQILYGFNGAAYLCECRCPVPSQIQSQLSVIDKGIQTLLLIDEVLAEKYPMILRCKVNGEHP